MKITPMLVTLVDHMGTDLSVVNAARVSMAKESDWQWLSADQEILPERDEKLIKYLSDNNHWTPFGHAFATFRIKAPIFVARQLVKHQVGLCWNEVSRRYVDEEPEFWFPKVLRQRPVGGIKQGSGDNHWSSREWLPMMSVTRPPKEMNLLNTLWAAMTSLVSTWKVLNRSPLITTCSLPWSANKDSRLERMYSRSAAWDAGVVPPERTTPRCRSLMISITTSPQCS